MNANALRLAIVGCGDVARYTAFFARLNPRVRLAACCDTSAERAAAFAGRYRIPRAFTAYSDMLAQAAPDAVYLAVPHAVHACMAEEAMAAGIPVLLEKPLARTLAEGQEIVEQATRTGVKVGVNYQYRYDAGAYALARAVQAGDLGAIYYARCNLAWRRKCSYFTASQWHATRESAGGGTLLTQGSHLLDLALWALGAGQEGRPVAAIGHIARRRFRDVEVEDLAQGVVELAGGASIAISSSMAAAADEALSVEVYGSAGSAHYSDRPWPHVRFRGARVPRRRPPAWGLHALQRSLEGFRAWVAGGPEHLTPAAEALPVLAAVDALYRSAASGRREMVETISTSA